MDTDNVMTQDLEQLLELLRELKARRDTLNHRINSIKEHAMPILAERGNYDDGKGGYLRRNVPTKPQVYYATVTLEVLRASDSEFKAKVDPHRKEKPPPAPSVSFK